MVLATMLMESRVDPFDAQEAKPYKQDPEVCLCGEGSLARGGGGTGQGRGTLHVDACAGVDHSMHRMQRFTSGSLRCLGFPGGAWDHGRGGTPVDYCAGVETCWCWGGVESHASRTLRCDQDRMGH